MTKKFDIIGYEDQYMVTKSGKVWSKYTKKYLKIMKDKDGYSVVNLYKNKVMKTRKVHRLVGINFIDNPKNYKLINHIDGDKSNNSITNLEWCNDRQNKKHAFMTGLMCNKGINHSQSKLTEEQVLEIRYLLDNTLMKNVDVARKFGVRPQTTSNIKTRKTWRHL